MRRVFTASVAAIQPRCVVEMRAWRACDSCEPASAYSVSLIQMPFPRRRAATEAGRRYIPGAPWPQGIVWPPFDVTRGPVIRREWPRARLSSVGDPCIYMRNLSGIRNDVAGEDRPRVRPSSVRSLRPARTIEASQPAARRREGGRRTKGEI